VLRYIRWHVADRIFSLFHIGAASLTTLERAVMLKVVSHIKGYPFGSFSLISSLDHVILLLCLKINLFVLKTLSLWNLMLIIAIVLLLSVLAPKSLILLKACASHIIRLCLKLLLVNRMILMLRVLMLVELA
jgi:hypothetical protein